jgi:hypothetical protein
VTNTHGLFDVKWTKIYPLAIFSYSYQNKIKSVINSGYLDWDTSKDQQKKTTQKLLLKYNKEELKTEQVLQCHPGVRSKNRRNLQFPCWRMIFSDYSIISNGTFRD